MPFESQKQISPASLPVQRGERRADPGRAIAAFSFGFEPGAPFRKYRPEPVRQIQTSHRRHSGAFSATTESESGYERYWTKPGRDKQKLIFNGATYFLFHPGQSRARRERGLHWLRVWAREGNPLAAFNLGYAYDIGRHVRRSRAQAARWYALAYAGGFIRAKSFLAYALARSKRVEDRRRAVQLEIELADDGHLICAYNVGIAYEFGRGAEKDLRKAKKYYQRSARGGFVDAQLALGYWALHPDLAGRSAAKRNLDEAARWYGLAAAQGEPMAKRSLKEIAKLRGRAESPVSRARR